MHKDSEIANLIQSIDQMVCFLKEYLPLFTFNNNNFLTDDIWNKIQHSKLLNEMLKLKESELCDLTGIKYVNSDQLSKPKPKSFTFNCDISHIDVKETNLQSFITKVNLYSIDNCPHVTNINDVITYNSTSNIDPIKEMNFDGSKNIKNIYLSDLMSPKKQHEVECISLICQKLVELKNITKVVDIGSGLGYFGCSFALQSKCQVLGIEALEERNKAAIKRKWKLEKRLNHYREKSLLKPDDILYKTATCLINERTNLKNIFDSTFQIDKQLLKENEDKSNDELMLTGLHVCGDLSTNVLKIFAASKHARLLCLIGCCYNLLTENSNFDENDINCGFPLSTFLKNQKIYLGHVARNIAAQSKHKSQSHMKSHDSLFWRSLLQVIIKDYLPSNNMNILMSSDLCTNSLQDSDFYKDSKVGRLASKCLDFKDYVNLALRKFKLDIEIDTEKYMEKYQNDRIKCLCFFHLRAALGPVIENLLILDRLLWILQQDNIESAYIVKLFDSSISPRSHAILAFKK